MKPQTRSKLNRYKMKRIFTIKQNYFDEKFLYSQLMPVILDTSNRSYNIQVLRVFLRYECFEEK